MIECVAEAWKDVENLGVWFLFLSLTYVWLGRVDIELSIFYSLDGGIWDASLSAAVDRGRYN